MWLLARFEVVAGAQEGDFLDSCNKLAEIPV